VRQSSGALTTGVSSSTGETLALTSASSAAKAPEDWRTPRRCRADAGSWGGATRKPSGFARTTTHANRRLGEFPPRPQVFPKDSKRSKIRTSQSLNALNPWGGFWRSVQRIGKSSRICRRVCPRVCQLVDSLAHPKPSETSFGTAKTTLCKVWNPVPRRQHARCSLRPTASAPDNLGMHRQLSNPQEQAGGSSVLLRGSGPRRLPCERY